MRALEETFKDILTDLCTHPFNNCVIANIRQRDSIELKPGNDYLTRLGFWRCDPKSYSGTNQLNFVLRLQQFRVGGFGSYITPRWMTAISYDPIGRHREEIGLTPFTAELDKRIQRILSPSSISLILDLEDGVCTDI